MSTHGRAQKHCCSDTQRLHESWKEVHAILVGLQSLWIRRLSITSKKKEKNFEWRHRLIQYLFIFMWGGPKLRNTKLHSPSSVLNATAFVILNVSLVMQVNTMPCVTTAWHTWQTSKWKDLKKCLHTEVPYKCNFLACPHVTTRAPA